MTSLVRALITLSVALSTTSAAFAHEGNTSASVIHACKKPNNQLRIVGKGANIHCQADETPLHWAIAGPQGPQGVPGPPGPGTAFLIDSQNTRMGPLFATGALGDVLFLGVVVNTATVLRVAPTGFIDDCGSAPCLVFWHTTNNCSGTRYLDPSATGFYERGVIAQGLLYVAANAADRTVKSIETFGPADNLLQPGQCCALGPTAGCGDIHVRLTGDVTTVPYSSFGFVPPFRLE